MDTSGRIHEIPDCLKPKGMVPVKGYPNPQCNDCLGRGFQRMIIAGTTLMMPCQCLGTTEQTKAKGEYHKMCFTEPDLTKQRNLIWRRVAELKTEELAAAKAVIELESAARVIG